MAQDDVLTGLKRQGFKVHAQEAMPPNSYLAIRNDEIHNLSFCNGRLTAYGYTVPGGIRSFIRRVNELTAKRGDGNYSVMSTESNVGELNSLTFEWREGNDTLKVSYFARSEASAESVSVPHVTPNDCRK